MGGKGSGGKPREYPPELVEKVRHLYVDCGMTVAEVQAQINGAKVQTIMSRYGIPSRRAIKRNQWGENNSSWLGDGATYKSLHHRLYRMFGTPSVCEWCGHRDEGRFEWANLTGHYTDLTDYVRLCVSCHRRYDAKRRRETGQPTMGGGA